MSPDILIVRDSDGYRILHGHLHLANALSKANEIIVDIKGAGIGTVMKTSTGFVIHQNQQDFPLLIK